MQLFGRQKIAMLVGEFLGTGILTLAIATLAKQGGAPYFVGTIAGVAVAALTLMVARVSGGHFNPVVTLGMWTVRRIPTLQALLYIAVQMFGGFVAFKIYEYLNVSVSLGDVVANWDWRVLVAEAIGAFIFTFGFAAATFQDYKGLKAASLIGASLFLGVLVAGLGSNAIVNPAVALGIDSWGRAYIYGPIIGAIVGMNLYVLLFAPVNTLTLSGLLNRRTAAARTTTSRSSSSRGTQSSTTKKKPAKRTRK